MKRIFLCFMMALYACFEVGEVRAETLVVGMMNVDRPPYFWRDNGGGYQGLFVDILKELENETHIHFTYKALPQARIRLYMTAGKIDVEPGIALEWRKKKEEVATSVFTEPFKDSDEVYISRAVQDDEKIGTNPIGSKFCGVLGFTNPEVKREDKTQELLSEKQVISMIDKKRCDYTIMEFDVFRYLMLEKDYSVTASQPISTYALRFRLNKRHKALIPVLDGALSRIKQDGRLAKLIHRYQ